MAKCSSCNQHKGNRFCPALRSTICSPCCGEKREREIPCPQTCEYLKKGSEFQLRREIERKINADLHSESGDVFNSDEGVAFVMPLEKFFVDRFYPDRKMNDTRIYESLSKIYAYQTGILSVLKAENEPEELIFALFHELDKSLSSLSHSLKARAILRILRSIRSSSGGVLGNRNYLEMIYSQQTGQGKWAYLFSEMEES